GTLQPVTPARHPDVYVAAERGVEVRRHHDGCLPRRIPIPGVHVAHLIHKHIPKTDLPEQLGDAGGAAALRPRRGRERRHIGLPGAGPRVVQQVRALAQEIRDHKLPIFPNCAARTVISDIEPIVRIAEEVGIKIEAATFIGSSPIRQYTEDWTLDRILKSSEEAVAFAVKAGLPVMYVTEDTTRARPETLKALYGAAIDCGATRICLADTVGHATPDGVRSLV